jgi:hypothetical protein
MSQRGRVGVFDGVTDELVPHPCSVVRENTHPGQGTVLVLGTPRGGTSVVAGICHMLGVQMGLDIDPSNMEDRTFQRSRASAEPRAAVARYFAELAAQRSLVGVKDPTMIDDLHTYWEAIPDPVLVVVSRDVYATAQREQVSGVGFFEGLEAAIRRKYEIHTFVKQVDAPLLIVSYERLLQDPRCAVEGLATFLVNHASSDRISAVTELIKPHARMPEEVDFVAACSKLESEVKSLR